MPQFPIHPCGESCCPFQSAPKVHPLPPPPTISPHAASPPPPLPSRQLVLLTVAQAIFVKGSSDHHLPALNPPRLLSTLGRRSRFLRPLTHLPATLVFSVFTVPPQSCGPGCFLCLNCTQATLQVTSSERPSCPKHLRGPGHLQSPFQFFGHPLNSTLKNGSNGKLWFTDYRLSPWLERSATQEETCLPCSWMDPQLLEQAWHRAGAVQWGVDKQSNPQAPASEACGLESHPQAEGQKREIRGRGGQRDRSPARCRGEEEAQLDDGHDRDSLHLGACSKNTAHLCMWGA